MKKKLGMILLALLVCGIYFFIEHGGMGYLNGSELEIAETSGTIMIDNYFTVDGMDSNFIVIGNNYAHGFSNTGKENFDMIVSLKEAISSSKGDYCIIGENNGTKVYMINSNAKTWEADIQGNLLGVSVNKNGYAAIIYKQVGYKSLIKVVKPNGTELFTTYLASTYAIDAEISDDNKTLAIAEINTDGIIAKSFVELVNMTDLENKNATKFEIGEDILINNIEYLSKDKLIVQTDKNIKVIDKDEIKDFVTAFSDNAKIVTIENGSRPIIIEKRENGLFDVEYMLKTYAYGENAVDINECIIESLPSIVTSKNDKIAMLVEKELIIANLNGRVLKKYKADGNIKSIVIFNNGNSLAVVYRDKVDFIKI